MEKTERQLNLIALLLNAQRPRTLAQIHDALYRDQPSEDSFKRMFERDKEDLRSLGVAVEVDSIGAWGDEQGYVVRRDETLLPDLGLTPAEHAALMLAAEAWGDGMLGSASPRMAAMKLAATSSEAPPVPWILPHVDAGSPTLGPLTDAIVRRKTVTFRYRRQGATEPAERTVEPHGLAFRSAWYLTGFDRERGERRSFKLDRIEGGVTLAGGAAPDFEQPPRQDAVIAPEPDADAKARIAVDEDVAWWVERLPGSRRAGSLPDGRAELVVDVGDAARFVRWAAGLAQAAEVLEPADLRNAIAGHLRRIAEAS